ncbi:MAG TPA: PspC domain-containing protein [Candidatus Paceibacterota bacterium]|nr:PspC domain-containing protein [Candidatus Paceibacterota bacterium]
MNKVVTIHLHGTAFEIEEGAYDALRRYLDEAAQKLEGNPDRDEIVADLEQAIADKCALYRTQHKTVITSADMAAVLKEMGDVDVETENESGEKKGEGDNGNKSHSHTGPTPKRLFRLEEGKVFFGVCSGLAAYFDVDATLVRILFIILTIISHGAGLLIYFLMVIFVPRAASPAQKAQAYGTVLINASELMRRARMEYEHFNAEDWKEGTRKLKEEAQQWKRQWRKQRRMQAKMHHTYNHNYQYKQMSPFWHAVHSLLGMLWFAFIIFCGWFLYTHVPGAHHAMDSVAMWVAHIFAKIGHFIDAHIGA